MIDLDKEIEELELQLEEKKKEREASKRDFVEGEVLEFSDYEDFRSSIFGALSFKAKDGEFYPDDGMDWTWEYARRPIITPGILIRWFGGECPVDGDIEVIILNSFGEMITNKAGEFKWGDWGDNARVKIIAYMVVPEWIKLCAKSQTT